MGCAFDAYIVNELWIEPIAFFQQCIGIEVTAQGKIVGIEQDVLLDIAGGRLTYEQIAVENIPVGGNERGQQAIQGRGHDDGVLTGGVDQWVRKLPAVIVKVIGNERCGIKPDRAVPLVRTPGRAFKGLKQGAGGLGLIEKIPDGLYISIIPPLYGLCYLLQLHIGPVVERALSAGDIFQEVQGQEYTQY